MTQAGPDVSASPTPRSERNDQADPDVQASPVDDRLRPHAEQLYAARAGSAGPARHPAATAAVAPVAVGGGHLPDGRAAAGRDGDQREVHRVAPADRGRCRDARHRPRAAAARCARHGEVVGVGAPGRRDLGTFDAADPGHLGHPGGGDPLRLELRPAAGRGAERGCARPVAGDDGDAGGTDRQDRGADPDRQRRPGRVDHGAVGEGAAGARAGAGGAGAQGLQRDRDRQRPGQGRQRAVVGAAAPVQHRRAAAAGRPRGRGTDRQHPGGRAVGQPRAARGAGGRGRDPPGGHRLPRAALGRHARTAGPR